MYTLKVIEEWNTHETTFDNEDEARKVFKESLKMLKEQNEYYPQDLCILLRDDNEVLEEEYIWAIEEE